MPDHPDAAGAALSRDARAWLSKEWSGDSFMAIGMTDPVVTPSDMRALHAVICDCPEPYEVTQGHFLQEWGEEVAALHWRTGLSPYRCPSLQCLIQKGFSRFMPAARSCHHFMNAMPTAQQCSARPQAGCSYTDNGEDPGKAYWALRREVAALFDVPERPIEINGPDAVLFLELIFARPLKDLKTGCARYVVACTHDGGLFADGILLRLGATRFGLFIRMASRYLVSGAPFWV